MKYRKSLRDLIFVKKEEEGGRKEEVRKSLRDLIIDSC